MNVYSVDNDAKSFAVIFGGAYSGTYDFKISHKKYGLIDTKGMILTVGSEVTSFGPNSGSIYGGTLITLEGTNWDPEIKLNNPVEISFNGALGNSKCDVLTTSSTKITCRIEEYEESKKKENEKEGKILVFLKTSEEAYCENPNCQYKFLDVMPTVEKVEKEWDSINNEWTIKVSGKEFTGNELTTEFMVDGVS